MTSSSDRFHIPLVRRIIPSSASSSSSSSLLVANPDHSKPDRGDDNKQVHPGGSMKYSCFSWTSIRRRSRTRRVYIPRVLVLLLLLLFLYLLYMSLMFTITARGRKSIPYTTSSAPLSSSYFTTLRCFTTPGCFPMSTCRTRQRPRKLKRRKQWEERSFCVDDLMTATETTTATTTTHNHNQSSCLVYSFGIHESYEWEEKMASLYSCEVHAFDPTMNHRTNLAPGVTFHKMGLQSHPTTTISSTTTNAAEYEALDPTLLFSLETIRKKLGHEHRTLQVLMLDCEGCEWGVLHTLACSSSSSSASSSSKHPPFIVQQLVVEFHFQKNLGLETYEDIQLAAEAIQCLWDDQWHITSIEESGASRENYIYLPGVSSILRSPGMLLYVALRRITRQENDTNTAITPAELLHEYANAEHDLGAFYEDTINTYGYDRNTWPSDRRDKLVPLLTKSETIFQKYTNIVRDVAKFDEWERIP